LGSDWRVEVAEGREEPSADRRRSHFATFSPALWIESVEAGRRLLRPSAPKEAAMQTIALVDDDRNILTSVAIALEAEGFRINIRWFPDCAA
jgi:hypothetical protein